MTNAVETARAIVHTPGVVGGAARLDGTRIPIWILANWMDAGWSTEKIRSQYPHLSVADIEAARAYAASHPDEMASEFARNDSEES